MKIGFGVPVSGAWATPTIQTHVAHEAERLGYHSLWTFQRLLLPADAERDSAPVYRSVTDPLITLAFLAGQTSRVRLGTAIVNIPLISPALLAKQASTLDIASGGRLDLGLGLGWSATELTASGAGTRGRGRRAEEFLTVLRRLWSGELTSFDGEFYTLPPSRQAPAPTRKPHPPLLLGGAAPAALRRIGRLADGWIAASRSDPADLPASIATIRDAAERAGRDPRSLRIVWRGVVRLRDQASARDPLLTGDVARVRRGLAHLAEAGVTETFLDLNFDERIGSPDADPRTCARHADEVLAAFAPGPSGELG